MSNFCKDKWIYCEFATDLGFCAVTGCRKESRVSNTYIAPTVADYIAAVEALDDSNDAYIKENERLKNRIAELETQLPKEGKWIPGRIISEEYIGRTLISIDFEDWKCSVCGIVVEQPHIPKWNYCPNCGASMDGEEQADERM